MEKRKRRLLNLKYAFALLALIGFGSFFVFYAHGFFVYMQDGRRAQQNSDIAREMFADTLHQDYELVSIDYEAEMLEPARRLTRNEAVVGFLTIPGTNVGDLVVQGADNYFYLTHDAYGNANANGALFMDYRNSRDFSDLNTIIYGHNMRNGTMFHNLRYYMNQDFFERHPRITIVGDRRILTYEIFAAFSTNIDFYYIQVDFKSPDDFGALINEIMRRSVISTGVTATAYDRILILSTCTNEREDMRFVVAARLMY